MEPKYRRRPAEDTKIAPFAAQLTKALEIDAQRPKRDRRTALKLFREIQASGFVGDYSRVTEFVRHWRENGGRALVKAYAGEKGDVALGEVITSVELMNVTEEEKVKIFSKNSRRILRLP